MGGCTSRSGNDGLAPAVSPSQQRGIPPMTIGKNKPLVSEKPKWKSEIPITMGQLRSKRDEYWDTQPAFGGRVEIFDALRAASETDDNALAQAIIDGANIALPSGSLLDAYDELGNHYAIPVYCISLPTNIIHCDESTSVLSESKETIQDSLSGEEIVIKIRLSNGNKDSKMTVHMDEHISSIKRRIHLEYGILPSKQRCFFSGKILSDKLTIEDTKISKGFLIQVIVAEP